MAKRKSSRLKGVRHHRAKIESAIERVYTKQLDYRFREKTVTVKVRIQRNDASTGAGGNFKALYRATACPTGRPSAPVAKSDARRATIYKRDGYCGHGYGQTPTKAFHDSLRALAKKKR